MTDVTTFGDRAMHRTTVRRPGLLSALPGTVVRTAGAARFLAAVMAIALAGVVLAPSADAQQRAPESFADLAERLLPSVVNISTTQVIDPASRGGQEMVPQFPPGSPFEEFFRDFFERRQQRPEAPRRATSLGSGFIIDPTGYVVTNNHVIADADEITVVLWDDTSLPAEVIGRDSKTDLAVLKVTPESPLPAVPFGDSDGMRVGDWIMAIGNPFGLGGTVTAGIISARGRDINAGPYDEFLQTDASINRGNSGGPMFNLDGEVIGVNTAIFSPSGGSVGIGFAIPSNLARNVVDQLRDFGRTRRGWLGVRIQTVTDELAQNLGLNAPQGALVSSVTEGGPAQAAGIVAGDVILEFNRRDIDEMRSLPRVVAETSVDQSVDVVIWRDGQRRTVQVRVGELELAEESGLLAGGPADDDVEDRRQVLGLELSRLTDALRDEWQLPPAASGVLIIDVEPGTPAEEKGLTAGTLIVEVDQDAVNEPSEVVSRVEQARRDGRRSVLLLVETQGDPQFVALVVGG